MTTIINKIFNTVTTFIKFTQHSLTFITCTTIINKVSIGKCYNMENILNLFEKFLYIINDRHGEVMCAKYGRSRMNGAHTVRLADFVGLSAKVVQPTAFFLKKKVNFVQLLSPPLAGQHGSLLMKCI